MTRGGTATARRSRAPEISWQAEPSAGQKRLYAEMCGAKGRKPSNILRLYTSTLRKP
jgi:hypothetical protein